MATDLPELIVEDANAWRFWLRRHQAESAGVWLVLAKKGTKEPTRLTYDEALEEALCHGWIDGQLRRRDEVTYCQRFTPRGARSRWSRRNVAIAERLIAEGRMQETGLSAAEQARGDGRWESAYAGSREIEVPDDLAAALHANRVAQAMFDRLTSRNRYALLYRIGTAQRPDTRARRVAQFVEMLVRGETIYPQGPSAKAG